MIADDVAAALRKSIEPGRPDPFVTYADFARREARRPNTAAQAESARGGRQNHREVQAEGEEPVLAAAFS